MTTTLNKLKHAHTGALLANGHLLVAWRAHLSAERKAELAEFERKGLRLGLQVLIPGRDWIVTIVLLDAAGGIVPLETIEQSLAGASTATN